MVDSWLSLTGWLLLGAVTLLALWVWRACQVYDYFKKMGIPGPKPYPLVGNLVTLLRKGFVKQMEEEKANFGKIYGTFFMRDPNLVIGDPDMLRDVMVKKFHYFPNRVTFGMKYKPWKDMLLGLEDDHWKHVRTTLSPTFSSGKMKRMIPAIQRVVTKLMEHMKRKDGEMIEIKDICSRFTMDVIAAVAFGIDINSIDNPDEQFVKHAYDIIKPNPIRLFLFFSAPKLLVLFNKIGLFRGFQQSIDFFGSVTEMALKDRQQDDKKHHDFLQLLVEAEQEESSQAEVDAEINHGDQLKTSSQWTRKGITMDEKLSNALLFFLAGYETVSTVISFTLFCLANNPECLKKVQEEIDEKLGKKMMDYDAASELTYLECCVNESMRLYPPAVMMVCQHIGNPFALHHINWALRRRVIPLYQSPRIIPVRQRSPEVRASMVNRKASDDVEIAGIKIKKGMAITIPTYIIHRDPDFWPEPEKFDPERHTTEARADHHPFSFMPFGLGPRNCIGMRLAQLEVRMTIATVLQHFNLAVCEKTVYPVRLTKTRMAAEDGLWVKLQQRD